MNALESSTHQALVKVAHRWLTTRGMCDFAYTEFGTGATREMPDALGFLDTDHTVLIEVKVSRADFLADRKKPWRQKPETGMGDWRYFLAPKGLLSADEIPENWGLLEVRSNGGVSITKGLAIHSKGVGKNFPAFGLYLDRTPPNAGEPRRSPARECWARCKAERWPKNQRAELALLYATARRLHVKDCWGILKTPVSSAVTWSAT